MKSIIIAALTVLTLAACSDIETSGSSDTAGLFRGEPHVTTPTGPYDNTANTPGSQYVGSDN